MCQLVSCWTWEQDTALGYFISDQKLDIFLWNAPVLLPDTESEILSTLYPSLSNIACVKYSTFQGYGTLTQPLIHLRSSISWTTNLQEEIVKSVNTMWYGLTNGPDHIVNNILANKVSCATSLLELETCFMIFVSPATSNFRTVSTFPKFRTLTWLSKAPLSSPVLF